MRDEVTLYDYNGRKGYTLLGGCASLVVHSQIPQSYILRLFLLQFVPNIFLLFFFRTYIFSLSHHIAVLLPLLSPLLFLFFPLANDTLSQTIMKVYLLLQMP